ncbi:hypothetical protein BURPS1655_I0458 [Burkholderia pseudomallei 1655]|nr:hypothetical protein BURPS1655_I0458 [Burkholderia pseudomallei 1655]
MRRWSAIGPGRFVAEAGGAYAPARMRTGRVRRCGDRCVDGFVNRSVRRTARVACRRGALLMGRAANSRDGLRAAPHVMRQRA